MEPAASQRDGASRSFVELASALAHRLRNSLNAISLQQQYLERLLRKEPLQRRADVERGLAGIAAEVRNFGDALEGLRELQAPPQLRLEPLDVAAAAREAVEPFRRECADREIAFIAELLPVRARADASAVRRVVASLIGNAMDVLGPGGRLRVAVGANGASAQIVVSDTGPGMSEAVLARVFEPFFTTRASRVGLGLKQAKRLAEAHGGTIALESEPGAGTTCKVTLPRIAED